MFVPKAGTLPHLMVFGSFKFNFLALVGLVSEISGDPKFTLAGPAPPGRHLAETFLYPKRIGLLYGTYTTSNCVFNFNFLAPVVSDIIGDPKFTLRGPASPGRP